MKKLKVMSLIGTRPEIIRLSEVIKKCDKYFEHILVHTGQNYDRALNQIIFEDLNLRKPDYYLNAVGNNLGETLGNIIAESFSLMIETKPDAFLVLGDTNSVLASIPAKRLKIPIFHMEAGNRCFDENLPEETNRRIVDHIADVNLCYSEHARRYLIAEGTAKERTYVTGSPMAEVLSANMHRILDSKILITLNLKPKQYILFSAHREENIDCEKNFNDLMNTVNQLAECYQMPVIYCMHPRSKRYIEQRNIKFHPLVQNIGPFNFSDYNNLQINSFCAVSDSGTLPEEVSYFTFKGYPFPAVCIRTSTERPEAIDKGNFILGSTSFNYVLQAVDMAVKMDKVGDLGGLVPDYIDENVSTKVVRIIQSYTEIVNKMVWRKY